MTGRIDRRSAIVSALSRLRSGLDVLSTFGPHVTILTALVYALVMLSGCTQSNSSGSRDEAMQVGLNAQLAQSSSRHAEISRLDRAPQMLVEVGRSLGIDFVHKAVDHEQTYFMPRTVGSGAAFLDYDDDGRLDIYLLQNGGPDSRAVNRLYRQSEHGKFVDVTSGSGLDIDGYGMGVAIGDVNNDGQVDVVLNEYCRARLLLNRTKGETPRFEDVSETAGVQNSMWGTSTSMVDFDRDGWLDIVLVNYVNYDPSRWCADGTGRQEFCGPDAFPGRITKLLRNRGVTDPGGIPGFEDVTISSGLASQPGPGLGVYCADFDGDAWPDIFIANDGKPNHLWINQRDGTFREEAPVRGIAYNSMGKSEADMGIAIGDVNGDGLFDIYVTHLTTETNTLWTQGPRGMFQDRTATSGLTRMGWRGTGFGTAMVDLNNDGALDLVVANGRVERGRSQPPKTSPELAEFWTHYAERDQVFLNDGEGTFLDASEANPDFSAIAAVSRGLACADFDNDGRVDVLVTQVAGPALLFRNVAATGGHWLIVRAMDRRLKRDAYGAEVYVHSGRRRWMRWINPGYSYLCSNDPRAHFGLGNVGHVDAIDVRWPDGTCERFPGVGADKIVQLVRGSGQPIDRIPDKLDSGPTFVHTEAASATTGEPSGAQIQRLEQPPELDLDQADPEVADAVRRATEQVHRTPDDGAAWGKLGMILLAQEFYETASICLQQAALRDANNPRWPYLAGQAIVLTRPDEAALLFQQAVLLCGNDPPAVRLRLVELLLAQYRLSEADQHLSALLKDDADNPRARVAAARLEFLRGNVKRSIQILEQRQVLEADPKNAGLLLAEAYRRTGQIEQSDRVRSYASRQSGPDWPDLFMDEVSQLRTGLKERLVRADKLFGRDNVPESIQLLEETVERYPESLWAKILLGRALIRVRQLDQALEVLHQALALDANSVEAQFRIGVALYFQHKSAEAQGWFERAVALKPDFTMAYYNLAFCHQDQGDIEGAIQALQGAVRCEQNFFEAQSMLGHLLARQGRWEQALEHLQIAARLNPDNQFVNRRLREVTQALGGSE